MNYSLASYALRLVPTSSYLNYLKLKNIFEVRVGLASCLTLGSHIDDKPVASHDLNILYS